MRKTEQYSIFIIFLILLRGRGERGEEGVV
jgi:hypothetical protein